MKAVFRKELRSLFGGLTGWGCLALLLAAVSVSVFFVNVRGASPLFADNIRYLSLAVALFCGLIAADAFPGERRAHTERALYALPLSSGGIFMGKLLARLVVLAVGCVLMLLYPVALKLAAPSSLLGSGLASVLAVFAMGVMFMSAALCCSAFSRHAVEAFVLYAVLVALAYFMPTLAAKVETLTSLPPLVLVLLPALIGLIVWMVFDSVLAGFIAAAIVLVPLLLNLLRGSDRAVFTFIGRVMRAAGVFEPLTCFANSILDLSAVILWLTVALPFIAAGIAAVIIRRHGKRRAL